MIKYCTTYLHPIGHSPPLSHFWVGSHGFHIPLKVCSDILESREEGAIIVEED